MRLALLLALALAWAPGVARAAPQSTLIDRTQGVEELDGHDGLTAWTEDLGRPGSRLVLYRGERVTHPRVRLLPISPYLAVGPAADGHPIVTFTRCRGRGRRLRCSIRRFDPRTGAERRMAGTATTGFCLNRALPWRGSLLQIVARARRFRPCRSAGVFLVERGRRTAVAARLGVRPDEAFVSIADFNGSSALVVDPLDVSVRSLNGASRTVAQVPASARVRFTPEGTLMPDGTAWWTASDFVTSAGRLLRRTAGSEAPLEIGPAACAFTGLLSVSRRFVVASDGVDVRRFDAPAFAPGPMPRRVRGSCDEE